MSNILTQKSRARDNSCSEKKMMVSIGQLHPSFYTLTSSQVYLISDLSFFKDIGVLRTVLNVCDRAFRW